MDSENIASTVWVLERLKVWFNVPVRLAIDRSDAFTTSVRITMGSETKVSYDTYHNNETFQKHKGDFFKAIHVTADTGKNFKADICDYMCNLFYDIACDPNRKIVFGYEQSMEKCESQFFLLFIVVMCSTFHTISLQCAHSLISLKSTRMLVV